MRGVDGPSLVHFARSMPLLQQLPILRASPIAAAPHAAVRSCAPRPSAHAASAPRALLVAVLFSPVEMLSVSECMKFGKSRPPRRAARAPGRGPLRHRQVA